MTLNSKECPADLDGVAESCLLGTLPKDQAIVFEDHYVACTRCATVLEKTAEYLDAVRAAAKQLRSAPLRAAADSATS